VSTDELTTNWDLLKRISTIGWQTYDYRGILAPWMFFRWSGTSKLNPNADFFSSKCNVAVPILRFGTASVPLFARVEKLSGSWHSSYD